MQRSSVSSWKQLAFGKGWFVVYLYNLATLKPPNLDFGCWPATNVHVELLNLRSDAEKVHAQNDA